MPAQSAKLVRLEHKTLHRHFCCTAVPLWEGEPLHMQTQIVIYNSAMSTCFFSLGVGPTHASGTGGAAVFVASEAQGVFYVSSLGGTLNYQLNDDGIIVMSGPAGYV